MTTFGPPQEPFGPQDRFDAEMTSAGPAPMSGLAVAGFVSSLIVCCPVLSPLLGLILSLVGLAHTKDGLRRGRGLAIAGLGIALLVNTPIQVVFGVWSSHLIASWVQLQSARIALETSNFDSFSSILYEFGSQELKERISEDEFRSWLDLRLSDHGPVQTIGGGQGPLVAIEPGMVPVSWSVQFADTTVVLTMFLTMDVPAGRLLLENIEVDGDSLLEDEGPWEAQPAHDSTGQGTQETESPEGQPEVSKRSDDSADE